MIVIRKCIVCNKEFEAYKKPNSSRVKSRTIRRSNSITCSRECSRKVDYHKMHTFIFFIFLIF